MSEQEVLEVLREVGAVKTGGHFVYASDLHGEVYVDKRTLYPHTIKTSKLCEAIARRFKDENVDVVIAPALGGIILSHEVANHLTSLRGCEVFSVYAEKEIVAILDPERKGGKYYIHTGDFVINPNQYKWVIGKRVLVVEDILTTGGSAKKVIDATRAIDGDVIGLGALVNRGGVTTKDLSNVPRLDALVSMKLETWSEAECPLCKENIPINIQFGKGREFLARTKV